MLRSPSGRPFAGWFSIVVATFACAIALGAHAATPARTVGKINPCASTPLQINFSTTSTIPNCLNSSVSPSPWSIGGLTYTPATLSGTGATYTTALDSAGVLHDFSSGARRITSAGVLIEPASTNLVLHSQHYNGNWSFWNNSVTDNDAAAPDGTTTAALLSSTANGGALYSAGVTDTATTTYTGSFYWKYVSGTTTGVGLTVQDNAGGNHDDANCTTTGASFANGGGFTGAVTGDEAIGNGWYRCWITFTTTATGYTNLQIEIWPGQYGGSASGSMYVWGAQIESGKVPTSYIATTTASVTRSADVLTLASSLFNGSQIGTVNFNGWEISQSGSSSSGYGYFKPSSSVAFVSSSYPWLDQTISEITIGWLPAVPPQAAAAGFRTLVRNDFYNFSTATVDTGHTFSSGYKWYCAQNPCTNTITINGDGSVAVQATSYNANAGLQSTGPTGSSPYYVGTAYSGGFYVQAELKWDQTSVITGDGWPSFWTFPLEHNQVVASGSNSYDQWTGQATNYEHFSEPDIVETNGGSSDYQASHDWYGIYQSTCSPSAYCDSATSYTFTPPPSYNWNTYHVYGARFIPATSTTNGSFTVYRDGKQISQTTWSQYVATSDTPPPSGSTPWRYGIYDVQHILLIIGSGTNIPITMAGDQVWQLSTSGNDHN